MFKLLAALFLIAGSARSGIAQDAGVLALRNEDPSLTGAGITVGHAEASVPSWQVSPAAVGQPESRFTWWLGTSAASTFPNALGQESIHADIVGQFFYGTTEGIAPGVSQIHNYDAEDFYEVRIVMGLPIAAAIVNQSFIFEDSDTSAQIEANYDDYAARFNTLFISGLGNTGVLFPPASAYNGIAVAAPSGATSLGPTTDGRSKPDISASGAFTSYSTPLVAGAAAILLQAAARGDGGAGSVGEATNSMTLKALLLNGALKPSTWTNQPTSPLDFLYGAGWLNVYNSYRHLREGRAVPVEKETASGAALHPPGADTNNLALAQGWDLNTVNSGVSADGINHYYFQVPSNAPSTALATLTWNRHSGETALNNLDLFLVRTEGNVAVGVSTSAVDNVEHIFLTGLAPGRYDLRVVKRGGPGPVVSNSETYALAFHWARETLTIERLAEGLKVSWPLSGADFRLESSPAAGAGSTWSVVTDPITLSNGRNCTIVSPQGQRFYRLKR